MAEINVVMADDHRMFVEAVEHLFEGAPGLSLIGEASNGDDLLALVRRHKPDVAIVDVSMPGPGIVDLLAQIKAAHPACGIVVLTMHLDAHLPALLLGSGADGYVVKEAAFREMLLAVRAVAAGERFLSTQVEALQADGPAEVGALTPREIECLRAVADGMSNRMIAKTLTLSERTVRFHLENVCRKLGASRRGEAVAIAGRHGLL